MLYETFSIAGHSLIAMHLFVLPITRRMKLLAFCFFLLGVSVCLNVAETSNSSNRVSAQTSTGSILGQRKITEFGTVSEFLGIPYAEPPVGELRFQVPRPVKPWRATLETNKFSPACMQEPGVFENVGWVLPSANISEDCLYLNVWTTSNITEEDFNLRPVLFWIHGGGYNLGSSDIPYYNGGLLSALGDIVVVSFNYRIGAFGFLHFGTNDVPGNMGFQDQLLAFKWVKENAKVFGGDPDKITVGGESAGSISITLHLLSPLSKGLFKKAILQSGAMYHPLAGIDPKLQTLQAMEFGKNLGCGESSDIELMTECLRKLDAKLIAKKEREITGNNLTSFLPSYGNDFMPENPFIAINKASFQNISLLSGSIAQEGTVFTHFLFPDRFSNNEDLRNLTLEEASLYIKRLFSTLPEIVQELVASEYTSHVDPSDSDALLKAVYDSLGDSLLLCPTVLFTEFVTKSSEKSSYMYQMNQRPTFSQWTEWMGMTHFDDVPYVFGSPFNRELAENYSIEDKLFSLQVMATWIKFIHKGEPRDQMGNKWLPYSPENPFYMELNVNRSSLAKDQRRKCKFWFQIYSSIGQSADSS